MITLSRFLKPLLRLSADKFPTIAAKEFGIGDEMTGVWPHFAPVAHTLVDSFWQTIDHPQPTAIIPRLEATDSDVRGVAYEGVGMGLAMLDCLWPTRPRLAEFIAGPGHAYKPLLYIGAGLALPRMHVNPLHVLTRHPDDERWLIMDGYGFYHGFFTPKESLQRMIRPRHATGYAGQVFDRGLGRSLWFTSAANTDRIATTTARFPEDRRGDLWSGVGFACAYAARVVDQAAIGQLVSAAGADAEHFAVGVAAAAEIRHTTCPRALHTDLACAATWGSDGATVAGIAAAERTPGTPEQNPPHYETWRDRVRSHWRSRQHNPIRAARTTP